METIRRDTINYQAKKELNHIYGEKAMGKEKYEKTHMAAVYGDGTKLDTEVENRILNTLVLENCEGYILKVWEKGKFAYLGIITGYNHNLETKYYEFNLNRGESDDFATIEEKSVYLADLDRDRFTINIYLEDSYELGAFTNDIVPTVTEFQYYTIERRFDNTFKENL